MSVQYSPDLAALADRPDFDVTLPEDPEPKRHRRIRRTIAAGAIFVAATFVIAGVFFIPVFALNLSRVEALEIAGQTMPVSVFAGQLSDLFWGTFVLALAFTSFTASLMLFAAGRTIHPYSRPEQRPDAIPHLTVLRLSGSER